MDVQLVLPGFEELVIPAFPDLDEMIDYLYETHIDNLGRDTRVWSLIKIFGITSSEACQVYDYWKALPKEKSYKGEEK